MEVLVLDDMFENSDVKMIIHGSRSNVVNFKHEKQYITKLIFQDNSGNIVDINKITSNERFMSTIKQLFGNNIICCFNAHYNDLNGFTDINMDHACCVLTDVEFVKIEENNVLMMVANINSKGFKQGKLFDEISKGNNWYFGYKLLIHYNENVDESYIDKFAGFYVWDEHSRSEPRSFYIRLVC